MHRGIIGSCQSAATSKIEQESRAIARKPRDAIRFDLMFADIYNKFKRKPGFRARHTGEKMQNLTQKVIQGSYVFLESVERRRRQGTK